jgi:hypothetical protein
MLGFNGHGGRRLGEAAQSLYAGRACSGCRPWAAGCCSASAWCWQSGCGSKTLVRMGGGNLKAAGGVAGAGAGAFATLRGMTACGARGHRGPCGA